MTLFCFMAGHSDLHPYMVYTEDLLVASPTWVNNVSGLPDRPIPGDSALYSWAADPFHPKDIFYGAFYEGASPGTTEALWKNSDLRNSGAWTKVFGLADITAVWASAVYLQIEAVATSPAEEGLVAITVYTNDGATTHRTYICHSHDGGATWTKVQLAFTFGGENGNFPFGLDIAPDGTTWRAKIAYFNAAGNVRPATSTDAGHTWATPDFPWNMGANSYGQYMPKASNPTGQILYHTDGVNDLWKATDGATYAIVATPISGKQNITGAPEARDWLWLFDNSGGSAPRYSTDGGSNWSGALAAAPNFVRVCLPVSASVVIGGMSKRILSDPSWTPRIGTYDVPGDAWTVRDGNLGDIAGADESMRFCAVIGIYEPPTPTITLLDPDHGLVGSPVNIEGTNFGAAQGGGTVTFGGVEATVDEWVDTLITVRVPSIGTGACDVVVTNDAGGVSAPATYTVESGYSLGERGREVYLVEYANPSLIPNRLRSVGFVTGANPPDYVRKIKPTWIASPELAPENRVVWGAVKYATADLVPARLLAVVSG